MMNKQLLTVLVIFITLITYVDSAEVSGYIYAKKYDNFVQLCWVIEAWPDDVSAFDVLRKSRDSDDNNWKKINSTPIRPHISKDKDWRNLGMNQSQIESIKTSFEIFVSKGMKPEVDSKELLNRIQSKKALSTSVIVNIEMDTDFALVYGVGYIDNTATANAEYEYALIPSDLYGNNKLNDHIVDTISVPVSNEKLDIKTEGTLLSGNQIKLAFEFPEAKYRDLGITGVNIYRTSSGNSDTIKASEDTVYPNNITDGKVIFYFRDHVENTEQESFNYKIVAKNLFGDKVGYSNVAINRLKAELLPQPSMVKANQDMESGEIRIRWHYPAKYESRIKGFQIYHRLTSDSSFTPVTALLESSTRQYSDSSRIYSTPSPIEYAVKVIDYDDSGKKSRAVPILALPNRPPPDIHMATASIVRQDNGFFINIEWKVDDYRAELYDGVVVYDDHIREGILMENMGLDVNDNSNNQKIIPIPKGNRTYSFKLIPFSIDGIRGMPIEIQKFVPKLKLKSPTKFKGHLSRRKPVVVFEWENAEEPADVQELELIIESKSGELAKFNISPEVNTYEIPLSSLGIMNTDELTIRSLQEVIGGNYRSSLRANIRALGLVQGTASHSSSCRFYLRDVLRYSYDSAAYEITEASFSDDNEYLNITIELDEENTSISIDEDIGFYISLLMPSGNYRRIFYSDSRAISIPREKIPLNSIDQTLEFKVTLYNNNTKRFGDSKEFIIDKGGAPKVVETW